MRGDDAILVFICAVALFFGGIAIGAKSTSRAWEKESAEKGFAEHDAKTGAWKWKESLVKE